MAPPWCSRRSGGVACSEGGLAATRRAETRAVLAARPERAAALTTYLVAPFHPMRARANPARHDVCERRSGSPVGLDGAPLGIFPLMFIRDLDNEHPWHVSRRAQF